MTVAELIEHLYQMPPEAPVWCEGCDCVNPATTATLHEDGRVWIEVDAR